MRPDQALRSANRLVLHGGGSTLITAVHQDYASQTGHRTPVSTGNERSLMGPYPAPAMNLRRNVAASCATVHEPSTDCPLQ